MSTTALQLGTYGAFGAALMSTAPGGRRGPRVERQAARRSEALVVSSVLERIARGDADAVGEALDLYGGLVWSIARRFTSSPSDAEDAVQEVFIDVWKSAARFDSAKASEKTFVAMIARRRLIDRLRKSERRPKPRSLPDLPVEPASDEHVTLERGVEATLAAESLKELRPEQRKVIELSIYYGMSHREISEATEIPVGTVKSHIWRGLAKVRDRLAEEPAGRREARP